MRQSSNIFKSRVWVLVHQSQPTHWVTSYNLATPHCRKSCILFGTPAYMSTHRLTTCALRLQTHTQTTLWCDVMWCTVVSHLAYYWWSEDELYNAECTERTLRYSTLMSHSYESQVPMRMDNRLINRCWLLHISHIVHIIITPSRKAHSFQD